MLRSKVNYVVDLITLIGVFGLIATGLVLEWVLPPGSGGRGGGVARVLWGGSRHDWGDIHFYIAAGLVALLVLHIALHWKWVIAMTERLVSRSPKGSNVSARRRNLVGVATLLLVVGLFGVFLWVAASNTKIRESEATANAKNGNDRGETSVANKIRGSMTLEEAAAIKGMSLTELRTALELPDSVNADARLGRLIKQYGFRMSDVRKAETKGGANASP